MGAKQISFELPEIDRKAMREAVEEALNTARFYKQVGYEPKETKITPSYEPRFHGPTNVTTSTTESSAIDNVDIPEMRRQHVAKVEWALSRLKKVEREIIIRRYLDQESAFDYKVAEELFLSQRTYDRHKARAIYTLGFALKLERYKS